jgi:hypothetical protein
MKVSVASLAILVASTPAFAIRGPDPRVEIKEACITVHQGPGGTQYAGSCDETSNNELLKKKILANGCAKDQALFTSISVELHSCPNPHIVQL